MTELEKTKQQNVILMDAMKEIAKGEGAFSMDKLTHANNTIDNMMSIAKQALSQVKDA